MVLTLTFFVNTRPGDGEQMPFSSRLEGVLSVEMEYGWVGVFGNGYMTGGYGMMTL